MRLRRGHPAGVAAEPFDSGAQERCRPERFAELLLGRLASGRWPHPASAYISGISVGILIRSPFLWAYALTSFLSIVSKYVLRYRDRHLWNPSNFGVSAVLFLAPETVSLLSIQWGNAVWPMAVIWALGFVIVWRVGKLHISATYVAAFVLFSLVRSAITGDPWLAEVAPERVDEFIALAGPVPVMRIGEAVRGGRLEIRIGGRAAISAAVAELEETWRAPLAAVWPGGRA